ncbi:diguanylate cyclase [Deinococcus sp.]|uniref:diguanylate cyclase n=1 Tax=Deinococcus sp. TaxID=47478 RepID=UPI00286993BB|nr:diguanylate cyclase [Deinococcus sp.]
MTYSATDPALHLRVPPDAAGSALATLSAEAGVLELAQAAAELSQAQERHALEDGPGALAHVQRAVTLLRAVDEQGAGDSGALVRALLLEAEIQQADEQFGQVVQLAHEVQQRLGETPSDTLADALNRQAMALFLLGRHREASVVTLQASQVTRALEDHKGYAKCLNNLGLIHIELGDLPAALGHLMQCFEYIAQCPSPLDDLASSCQINIGNIHHIMQSFDKAADAFQEGVSAARRAGIVANEIAGLTGMGLVAKDRWEWERALQMLLGALTLAQEHGRRYDEAEILDALGEVYGGLGQRELAVQTFTQALALAQELDALASQQNILAHLARLHLDMGQPQRAAEELQAALVLAADSGSEGSALELHELLGAACQQLGQFEQSATQFRHVLRLERALRDRESRENLLKLTAQLDVERSRHQAETYRLMNDTSQRARAEAEALVQERTAALEEAQREIITRLGIAGEYRDDKTGEHTQRVSQLAASLAAAVGVPDAEVELIRLAARLHDIGKIGVPDAVLLKVGRLTEEEFNIMRQHTTIGARLLEGGHSPMMRLAENIALTHHERWDGGGYPRGLSGEAIPLYGRIVAIVDVWDALTTDRPYKAAWTREEAWREMAAQSGKHFDPYLLEVFLGMIAGSINAGQDPGVSAVEAQRGDLKPGAGVLRVTPAHVLRHLAALNEEAWQLRRTEPARSAELAREAYVIAEQHSEELGMGYALRVQAFHAVNASEFRTALDKFDHAVAIAQTCGDLTLERDCLNLLGNVYRSIYNTERAVTCLLQSIELSRTLGDLSGEANALMNLGVMAASRMKDMERALGYYQQAYVVLEQARNEAGQVACLYSLADAFQELGRFDEAREHGQRAVETSRRTGDTLHHALSLSVIARALDAEGDHHSAGPLHQEALTLMLALDTQMPEPTAWIQVYCAANLVALGALSDAQERYERVLVATEEFDLKELAALAHHDLTQVYKRRGDMGAAMHHLEAERAIRQSVFEQEMAQKTSGLMAQYEVERAESEAALYKLRSVELASANVALEQANREKSALVAALQEQSQLLERQVREDSLSGVYNRRYIEQILAREFEEHCAEQRTLSVIMLDVDHFKQVNDTFSHLTGDEVLRQLGAILLTGCRARDAAGRYGGEEFVLVLPDTSLEDAVTVAERLRRQVEGRPWHEVAPGLRVTASMGVACSEGLENFERLVARADAKLYEAKVQRNRVAH